MAQVIQAVRGSTLVLAPNKTLAAQLAASSRNSSPITQWSICVYYDYYQPEAYIPQTDTYIEKDSSINDEIDKLRHSATALFERRDVIIVASVSCIYGLGDPEEYSTLVLSRARGMLRPGHRPAQAGGHPVRAQRCQFTWGKFRVRGDVWKSSLPLPRKRQSGWILTATWWKGCWNLTRRPGEILGLRSHVAVFPRQPLRHFQG